MTITQAQPEEVLERCERVLDALAKLQCPRSVALADPSLTPDVLAGEIRRTMRPLSVGCIGPFDSGKSTLLNNLLESEVLPSDWQPVTSALIFINHVARRPTGLDDHVFLMGASFQARNRHSAHAIRAHLVASGGIELLSSRARHRPIPASDEDEGWGLACSPRNAQRHSAEGKATRAADALLYDYVLVFVDRPALYFAEFVDTPGLGKSARDDQLAQQAITECDLFVTCHPPPAYGGEILQQLVAAVVKRLHEVDQCVEHPLGRMLLVITHANSDLEDHDLRHIRSSASARIAEVHEELLNALVAKWIGGSETFASDLAALVAQRMLPFSSTEPRRVDLVRTQYR